MRQRLREVKQLAQVQVSWFIHSFIPSFIQIVFGAPIMFQALSSMLRKHERRKQKNSALMELTFWWREMDTRTDIISKLYSVFEGDEYYGNKRGAELRE